MSNVLQDLYWVRIRAIIRSGVTPLLQALIPHFADKHPCDLCRIRRTLSHKLLQVDQVLSAFRSETRVHPRVDKTLAGLRAYVDNFDRVRISARTQACKSDQPKPPEIFA